MIGHPNAPANPHPLDNRQMLQAIRDPAIKGYFVDHSVPSMALDIPLVDSLPVTPGDRMEVNLVVGEGVARMLYRDSTRAWTRVGAASAVTAMPIAPNFGDEVYLSNGIDGVWGFVYLPTIDATYPWIFTGGVPLLAQVDTAQTTASTTYTDLATAGPSVLLPLAGVYDVTIYMNHMSDTANVQQVMSYDIGGTGAVDGDACFGISTTNLGTTHVTQTRRKTIAAASTTLNAKYKVSSNTGTFERRSIMATPVKVA